MSGSLIAMAIGNALLESIPYFAADERRVVTTGSATCCAEEEV
jgi:hypothetical protein